MTKTKDNGARIWATIIYPENIAYENLIEVLENRLIVECYLSPLHDADGVKSHYHLMVLLPGQRKKEDFAKMLEDAFIDYPTAYCGMEKVNSKTAYLKYLVHANADKAKYDAEKVLSLNGAKPYLEAVKDSSSKYDIVGEMLDYIDENNSSFCALVTYARHNKSDWWHLLVDSSNRLIGEYIRSKCWNKQ